MKVIKYSTIRCPVCNQQKTLKMPEDACQILYECSNCKTLLNPMKGDCCVFCSFGNVPCPPIQKERKCC